MLLLIHFLMIYVHDRLHFGDVMPSHVKAVRRAVPNVITVKSADVQETTAAHTAPVIAPVAAPAKSALFKSTNHGLTSIIQGIHAVSDAACTCIHYHCGS